MASSYTLSFSRVVYTPGNFSIGIVSNSPGNRWENRHIDFNNDGINDFVINMNYTSVDHITPSACPDGATRFESQQTSSTNGIAIFSNHVSDISTGISEDIIIHHDSHLWKTKLSTEIWRYYQYQSTYTPFSTTCLRYNNSYTTGIFSNPGYLGVKFKIGDHIHFGWIHIGNNHLIGYAYETIPGFPIKTGDKIGYWGSTDPNYNTIKGNVFSDLNGNCIKDIGETGIPNIVVYTLTNNFAGLTDENGNYEILVSGGSGSYTIVPDTVISKDSKFLVSCASTSVIATFSGNNQITYGKNFGLRQAVCSELNVELSSDRRRRCFRNYTTVHYSNSTLQNSAPALLKVILPEYVKAITSTPTWTEKISDTLIYDLGIINANSSGTIKITDSVSCETGVTGLTQCTRAFITPKNSCVINPLWDQSDIRLFGNCSGSTYYSTIENTGSGDMDDSLAYRIFINDTLAKTGKYKLASHATLEITIPTHGSTVRIEADQHAYHPNDYYALLAFEGCGIPFTDKISKGHIATMSADNGGRTESTSCLPIIDSWDPNEKEVYPKGIGSESTILQNSDLTYTIHFQNTGTDTAYTVVLVDTLNSHLNLSSLKIISSSHTYKLEVAGKENPRLIFIFPGINLVHSAANEPKSHGFITFSIAQKPNVPLGSSIVNKAYIFFDYNEAIITNETTNKVGEYPVDLVKGNSIQIGDIVSGNSMSLKIEDLKIFPIPAESILTIETARTGLNYELSNSQGINLKTGELDSTNKISIEEFPQGLYFLRISEGGKFLVQKIIKN